MNDSRTRWWQITAVLVLVLLVNLVAAHFVTSEQQLYTADHVAYWAMSSDLARGLSETPWQAIVAISNSVAHRQLNLLPAAPIALLMLVFGDSRTTYVLAVINLYALPSFLMLWLFLKRRGDETSPTIPCLLTMLVLPVFWYPISLGYLGVGGIVLGLAALTLYFDDDEIARRPPALIAVGVLIALIFVFRRWYAFWSAAFAAVVVIDCVIAWIAKPKRWRELLPVPLLIGAGATVTILVLALPKVITDLSAGYSDRFSAYKVHHTLIDELSAWPATFGGLTLLLAGACATILIANVKSRRLASFVAVQLVLTFGLMRQVQDPSPQHWYLYLPGLMIVLGMGFAWLGRQPFAKPGVAAVTALGVLLTCWVWAGPETSGFHGLLPTTRIRAVQRTDIGEIRRLLGFLDKELTGTSGFVHVIGATTTMSDTALSHANLSLDADFISPRRILLSSHVDRRDGFPVTLLYATHVVVTEPLQCRHPATDQRVIEVPGRAFLEGRHIAHAFARSSEVFELENAVKAHVFVRTRPTHSDELNALCAELRLHYPDRPEIYSPGKLPGIEFQNDQLEESDTPVVGQPPTR